MSTPVKRLADLGTPWRGAPRWPKEEAPAPDIVPGVSLVPEAEPRAGGEPVDYGREFRRQYEIWRDDPAQKTQADMLPLPPLREEPKFEWGRSARIALMAGGAALAAFYVVGILPNLNNSGFEPTAAAPSPDRAAKGLAKSARLEAPKLRLMVQDVRGRTGEWIALGAKLQGAAEGAVVVVGGLAGGTTLSAGAPLGPTGWQVDAGALATLKLKAPADAPKTQNLILEIRLADGRPVDRRAFRVDLVPARLTDARPDAPLPAAPAARAAEPVPVAPPRDTPEPAAKPALAPEEIEFLLRRGQDFISTGDIASARLLLERAARARDARAAFALASTYDPVVLETLSVYGAAPDLELAIMWYERAKQFGSRDAGNRLQALAQRLP